MAGNNNGDEQTSNLSGTSLRGILVVLVSTGLLGLLSSGMMSVASDASIAIKVAEQHGEELLLIRGELNSIRQEMLERTQTRYTAIEAERHERYVMQRIEALEKQLDACCSAK